MGQEAAMTQVTAGRAAMIPEKSVAIFERILIQALYQLWTTQLVAFRSHELINGLISVSDHYIYSVYHFVWFFSTFLN